MTSKVRVIVRVRPFLDHEISSKNSNLNRCISLLPKDEFDSTHEVSVHLKDQETSRNECYKLDGYFDQEDDNIAKIFEKEVKCLIPEIFNGCNATVFAYGATGSGKTFTMQGTDEQPGIMTLAISTILSMCQATGNIAAVSYYEVYLDRCYDLLEFKEKEISVLDDKEGQIHVKGLCRVPVTSLSEFCDVFARGIQRRKVAHTSLNDVSSRSHAVLVISVASSDNGIPGSIIGKMNLIDLAGNEDNKRSGNEGIRLQESAKINQSLFALSNVIYALNNNKPWIPYRESKLTRILQDSLGGKSRSLMVACVNPGNYQEAVHTVALAARSRNISNVLFSGQKQETPKVRIDMEEKLKVWLESKGKTKGSRRIEAFGSPFFLKTPNHGSSMKKNFVQSSSVKNKVAYQENPGVLDRFVPQRKLFDSESTSEYAIQELNAVKESPLKNEELKVHEHGSFNHDFVNSRHCLSEVKELSENDKSEEHLLDDSWFKSSVALPDELLEEDERAKNRANNDIHYSSDNRPKILFCQSPLRKALSPINCNISNSAINKVSSREDEFSANTPNTPFIVTRENPQDFKTPLEKFSACSSNLKSHLVQEYIDFLNSATREELVQLKGIGVKMAEYIMEVRESSPLKSLSDLQKIGLSSKQVQHLFGKAAKGIF
ncbi:kinesin-like protein KIN-10B isoform X2 [Silene latifolia]|uniref:kinesin-like protein KIN-10B isoform X2 n=1 Tax=Silene latifolia TaxID=37657 RepID=UPI003D782AD4